MHPPQLTRMATWAHRLLSASLRPGDFAIDLTAGRGQDSGFLSRQVGQSGLVLAFDLQPQALAATRTRLDAAGWQVLSWSGEGGTAVREGVILVQDDHAHLGVYLQRLGRTPRGVIANLGYLPGGDRTFRTRAETSLAALEGARDWLEPGGRLAVVLYVGHEGGAQEAEAVQEWFAGLDSCRWDVLQLQSINRIQSPQLLVAHRRR
jgi:Putative rRNA methylase